MNSVCLAVLNYNGVRHLECLLPTAQEAVARYGRDCPIVVLDNLSREGDADWVHRHLPAVEVAVAPQNDFLFSYNWLLAQRSEDIVVLLNNDLRLDPDFILPLVRHFDATDVFAVSATSYDWSGKTVTFGPAMLHQHRGSYYWMYDVNRQTLQHTLFCSGGFTAVKRDKFLELGGFNRLFAPAYCEDLDLCFRAWRRGWRCLFEPASIVRHRENGTWGGSAHARSARLHLRAQLLFQWASLPPASAWAERFATLLLTGWREWRQGRGWWLRVLFATWLEWGRVRQDYRWMKTPRAELDRILAKLLEPVPLSDCAPR